MTVHLLQNKDAKYLGFQVSQPCKLDNKNTAVKWKYSELEPKAVNSTKQCHLLNRNIDLLDCSEGNETSVSKASSSQA